MIKKIKDIKDIKDITINQMVLYTLISLWIKNIITYTNFNLGADTSYQKFLLVINPIALLMVLGAIVILLSKKKNKIVIGLFILSVIYSIYLFSNIIYYREFTDFLSINTILGAGAVTKGLNGTAFKMINITDLLYFIDIPFYMYILKKNYSKNKLESINGHLRKGVSVIMLGVLFFLGNLFLAELDRPQLLTRTFDKNYIVKYLGLGVYILNDGYNTRATNIVRAEATESNLGEILNYLDTRKTTGDEYTGIAKGKNVVYIHLESFQQFLIDYKLKDETGIEHEVTPFINSIYHGQDTLSFKNAFHQVGQGKTSDAELLIENSIYGLSEGSAMVKYGTNNTFESAPNIFNNIGYDTASMHGNVGSFWNRENAYKSFGYKHFYDSSYYNLTKENTLEYGLKDKNFLEESIPYLNSLQEPYYAKLITVSNHFPYTMSDDDNDFPLANTKDETINSYFRTANYLDKQLESFFAKLKEENKLNNTVFVLYGDHFGISNSRNKDLAELVGKTSDQWTNFDNAEMQRVPLMFYIPESGKGKISDKYVGQIDILPSLLDLMGVENKYIEFGQSVFSKENDNRVVFRNGDIITDKYSILGNKVYDKSGLELNIEELGLEEEIKQLKDWGKQELSLSDKLIQEDLMRFYSIENFNPVAKNTLNYIRKK